MALEDRSRQGVTGFENEKGVVVANPALMRLYGYLEMIAAADLRDLLAKEQRRKKLERRDFSVELRRLAANKYIGEEERQSRAVTHVLDELFADPVDRMFAGLLIDGERSTEKFAALLGLAGLPATEQRKIVKRHKDRIKKIFRRDGRRVFLEAMGRAEKRAA